MRKFWGRDRSALRERRDAESALWRQLRERRLAGLRFRRQHPIAGYVADFACVEAGLVVELERGDAPQRREYDRRREEILAMAGYRVLKFRSLDLLLRLESALCEITAQVSGQVVGRGAQP